MFLLIIVVLVGLGAHVRNLYFSKMPQSRFFSYFTRKGSEKKTREGIVGY